MELHQERYQGEAPSQAWLKGGRVQIHMFFLKRSISCHGRHEGSLKHLAHVEPRGASNQVLGCKVCCS